MSFYHDVFFFHHSFGLLSFKPKMRGSAKFVLQCEWFANKNIWGSWRTGSVVKRNWFSWREPGFNPQHLHGFSKKLSLQFQDFWCPFLASEGKHSMYIYTAGKTLMLSKINKLDCKFKKNLFYFIKKIHKRIANAYKWTNMQHVYTQKF